MSTSTPTPILAYLPYAELARIQRHMDRNHVRLCDLLDYLKLLENMASLAADNRADLGLHDLAGLADVFAGVSRRVRHVTQSMGEVNQQLMTQHNAAQTSV